MLAKVKDNNLNVTEVLVSDFKNAFPGIFNFTVGILYEIFREKVQHVPLLNPFCANVVSKLDFSHHPI